MLLDATVTKNEIQALIAALTPLRISIDERRGRSVTLGRPELELVPSQGLRLRGDALLTWDVAGVSIPITIQAWQVLLVPRVMTRAGVRTIAFEPILEELDLKHIPALVCGKITASMRDAVGQSRGKLAWSFGNLLSRQLALPNRLGAGALAFIATDAEISMTTDVLRFAVRLETALVAKANAGTAGSGSAVAA